MSAITYIDANEFIKTLKAQGLVIVPASDFEMNKMLRRKKLMKRTALTLKEIVDNELLPLKSKKSVNGWILNGKIHESEVIRNIGGKGMIKVLTSAIKRLGYAE